MVMKIRLVGCGRYGFRGQGYEQGKVYAMPDQKAKLLLTHKDDYGRPYFEEYVKPEGKSREERIAEAAARAAAEAARQEVEEELVDMSSESADAEAYKVEETDPDAPVEVDTDDDPSLDEEDEPNTEEVVEESEDRADGTEVAV